MMTTSFFLTRWFCIIIASVLFAWSGEVSAAVPGQFIAKMYSEALGRAPDAGGWSNYVGYFQAVGCNWGSLRNIARDFYLGSEYAGHSYDNKEKILTAYRGILSREPDTGGFKNFVGFLNNGSSFDSVLDGFFYSQEFFNLVPAICAGSSYGWGGNGAINIGAKGSGFTGTRAALQVVLDNAQPGTTIYIAQRAVIAADQMIIVRKGTTLATMGEPDRYHYATMGRIVRVSQTPTPLVYLEEGAQLRSVWVSGQRSLVGYASSSGENIFMKSGNGGAVTSCRTDSPAGWSTLVLFGYGQFGISCSNVNVVSNLSTGYTSHHTMADGGGWADGISNACEDAYIYDNYIIDPTDVGINLFSAGLSAIQHSTIVGNTIISAGLSAYAALAIDPQNFSAPNYSGSQMSYNQFWTSPNTHFDIGISVGTQPWGFTGVGHYASVLNNTTVGILTIMNTGIAIDGMLDTVVQGNGLLRGEQGVPRSACPSGNVLADVNGGHATASDLQPWSQATLHGCIGH